MNIPRISDEAIEEVRRVSESRLPDKDIHIDDIDMDFVQYLITAVNESKLNQPDKEILRKKLDRWQNALMLTHTIRVTF